MKEKTTNNVIEGLKFSFDISKAKYELDALHNKLLEFYLRADPRFRRAFSMNYTNEFLQYMKDKARLKEPIKISVIGSVRTGKSYSAITLACLFSAMHGKKFSVDYICANAMEFLEKLREMPENELLNSIFLIDEEKQAMYGYGSLARKVKLLDVQNIIAINNISTIMINPNSWANKEADYGIKSFGRCFTTKTCRFMLYNLQERGRGGELPLGNVYLPIFTHFLPKEWADDLEKKYLSKKHEWVNREQLGQNDVLSELRKKSAMNFLRDEQFRSLEKKSDKLSYITNKLGSEWTNKECEDVYNLTKLFGRGITFDD